MTFTEIWFLKSYFGYTDDVVYMYVIHIHIQIHFSQTVFSIATPFQLSYTLIGQLHKIFSVL